MAKYSRRERNRARDFIHKLITILAKEFRGHLHGFEHLKKKRMLNGSKEHSRKVTKAVQSLMVYKSRIVVLNPKNTSKRRSR